MQYDEVIQLFELKLCPYHKRQPMRTFSTISWQNSIWFNFATAIGYTVISEYVTTVVEMFGHIKRLLLLKLIYFNLIWFVVFRMSVRIFHLKIFFIWSFFIHYGDIYAYKLVKDWNFIRNWVKNHNFEIILLFDRE